MPTKQNPFGVGEIVRKAYSMTGAALGMYRTKAEPTSDAEDDEIGADGLGALCDRCGKNKGPLGDCQCAKEDAGRAKLRGRSRDRGRGRDRSRLPDRGSSGPADGQPAGVVPAVEARSLDQVAQGVIQKVKAAVPEVVAHIAVETVKAARAQLGRRRR